MDIFHLTKCQILLALVSYLVIPIIQTRSNDTLVFNFCFLKVVCNKVQSSCDAASRKNTHQ